MTLGAGPLPPWTGLLISCLPDFCNHHHYLIPEYFSLLIKKLQRTLNLNSQPEGWKGQGSAWHSRWHGASYVSNERCAEAGGGMQGVLPPSTAPWGCILKYCILNISILNTEYFKLEEFEKFQIQERFSDFLRKQIVRSSCERLPSCPQRKEHPYLWRWSMLKGIWVNRPRSLPLFTAQL